MIPSSEGSEGACLTRRVDLPRMINAKIARPSKEVAMKLGDLVLLKEASKPVYASSNRGKI